MAKDDKDYAKLLKIMRRQGGKDNPVLLELGEMTSKNTCMVGELELDADDLLVAEPLITGYHKAVNNNNPSLKNENTFVDPLKKGDEVVLLKIEGEDDTYVVLCKVVSL